MKLAASTFLAFALAVPVHAQIHSMPPGPQVDPPPMTVGFSLKPWINKDTNTGHFAIFCRTRELNFSGTATLTLTLDDQDVHRVVSVPVQAGTATTEFDLPQLNVPRFTRPMHFTVTAVVTQANRTSRPAASAMPEIKLPVVVVRGIKPNPIDPWEDSVFVTGMLNRGYSTTGGPGLYPTLFYLHFDPYGGFLDYDPTYQLLDQNARCVNNYVEFVTRTDNPITYADKVDIVAHSKGGLVSREYLYLYPAGAQRVRRLIMCASPHTGSLESWTVNRFVGLDAPKEYYPTYKCYRDFAGQQFQLPEPNPVLDDLNTNGHMPQSVEYHLLFGSTGATSTELYYTDYPNLLAHGDGDDLVLLWSAQGYDIDIHADETYERGHRIPAFDPTFGSRAPGSEIFLNGIAHSGFLGNAVATIYDLLSAPDIGLAGGVASTSWPVFRGDVKNRGYSVSPNAVGALNWIAPTGFAQFGSPAIEDDGTILVSSSTAGLVAVDPSDGTVRWSAGPNGEYSYASPAIGADGTIYANGATGLHALNPVTGRQHWLFSTSQIVYPPTIGANGLVYATCADGRLLAIDHLNGALKWSAMVSRSFPYAAPTVAEDGTVYIGAGQSAFNIYDAELVAFDGDTGAIRFSFPLGVNPTGGAALDHGILYVPTGNGNGGSLIAIRADGQSAIWSAPVYPLSTPSVSDDVVVVGGNYGWAYGLDKATGTVRWQLPYGGQGSPAITSGGLAYIPSNGGLHAVDVATGTERWNQPYGAVSTSPAVDARGAVYFGTTQGLLCIR